MKMRPNMGYDLMASLRLPVFRFEAQPSRLILISQAPRWLGESFGSRWDAALGVLSIPNFSALDCFTSDILERYRAGESVDSASMVFEEDSPDRPFFTGRVTACLHQYEGPSGENLEELLFVLQLADNLDTLARHEIQLLRETALTATAFGDRFRRLAERGETVLGCKSDVYLRALMEDTEQACVIVGGQGEYVMSNQAAQELFPELSPKDTESHVADFAEFFFNRVLNKSEVRGAQDLVTRAMRKPVQFICELPFPYRHQVSVRVVPVISEEGSKPAGALWSLRKKSAKTDLSYVVTESERLELMGRLAGGVAHDFNNLLGIILGNLALIGPEGRELMGEEARESIDRSTEAAERAADLVRQLLGYARIARLEKKIIHVDRLVHEVVDRFATPDRNDLSVELDLGSEDAKADVDEKRIMQVLEVLLDNAARALENKGKITVRTHGFILDDPNLSQALECPEGHYVIITVTDDGPGIPEHLRERVFEPFFSTRVTGQGSGLGLSNALGTIRQHGGNLLCSSLPGEGATFAIYLPVVRHLGHFAPTVNPCWWREAALDRMASHIDSSVVLVVDDEELLRNVVRTMLQRKGFRTIGAANGREALEILDVLEQEGASVSAIVMDVCMPEMDGTELFRQLNESGSEIPVIVVSGHLLDPEKFYEQTGGRPAFFFSKPFQLQQLLEGILQVTDRA